MSHRLHQRQHRAQSNASTTSAAPTTSSSLSRPPPALRAPAASRLTPRASHPHVSLVFARGDAAVPAGPPSLRRIANGASPSEEALSRQLDRDGAGERLGLRSRRSSTATLASVRTEYNVSVVALGVTSPAVLEEEEPVAGPSRPAAGGSSRHSRSTSPAPSLPGLPIEQFHSLLPRPPHASHSGTSTPQRRLNPKSSSTWRRWNQPSPSFPKARSRDTSRDRRGSAASHQPDTAPAAAATAAACDTAPGDNHPETTLAGSVAPAVPTDQPPTLPPATASLKPQDKPQDVAPQPSMNETEVEATAYADPPLDSSDSSAPETPIASANDAPPQKRGWMSSWWGSSEPAPAPAPAAKVVEATPLTTEPEVLEEAVTPVPAPASAAASLNGSAHSPTKVKANASEDTNSSGKRRKLSSNLVQEPARPPSVATVADVPAEPSSPLAPTEASNSPRTSHDGALVTRDEATTETTVNAVAVASQASQTGWGSYLVSFVYSSSSQQATTKAPSIKAPSTREPSSTSSTHHFVEPTDPVTDQKPVHSVELAQPVPSVEKAQPTQPSAQLVEPPTPRPTPQPTAVTSDADTAEPSTQITSPSPPQPKLATSSGSTGWLHYLAFRASQKKITGSTVGSDRNGRRSGETVREEVMDLDGDPDFPPAEAAPATAPATASTATAQPVQALLPPAPITTGKDAKSDPKTSNGSATVKSANSTQRLTHKRSQNLTPNAPARRQSNASSSASIPPMPPSPRTTASGAAHQPVKSSTSLPPPPKPPSRQPNLVIPSFGSTFDRPPRSFLPRQRNTGAGVAASTWRAFGAVSSYVIGDKTEPPEETRGKKEGRDVGRDLPRRVGLLGTGSPDDGWKNVKRIAVIGVHGWFPARMLNTVIGEPTGTSVKFATMMGEAVKQFFQEHNVDENDIRLTLIPLEGEGTIEHRVDKLYKAYLSNPAWINDVRRADAVMFAAHSQGCIVTTHLISRMIAQGHIRTPLNKDAIARCEWAFGPIAIVPDEASRKGRKLAERLSGAEGGRQKVAMLAMCGVHLGPLYSISTSNVIQPYLQWFENAAARELFEFQDSNSAVSVAYQRALSMILENEVKILLLSSINDQVVPIYGASFSTANHPNLLRALFVDGASYSASDFMTNLICFAFMLRNAGIDDQRLVEHLSEATAGSLTGVGHSSPYEELACYRLAVDYLFYSGPAAHPLPPLEIEPFAARDARNDFELPWIMRAIVDSPEVKDLFPEELKDLRDSILAWKPATKILREIKKRLEPMAGRQRLRPLATSNSSTSLSSMTEATPKPTSKVPPSRLRPSE
ncbi:hypothetical protein Q8F55_000353 [Vanrija albida]|uniref:YMC020W-like alpha/beta hydrolase domain-containing protein n=1 Tax=Vanrija albida TaxID=181172 RepID=A0ABR3QDZ8_9TREE